MAGSVATVWANLRLNMSDFGSKLTTASKDLRRFASQQRNAIKQTAGYSDASKMLQSFNRSLSDTINITRGIIISQAFYAAVGAIRDATSALWSFNVALDYMNVTYTALFGSKQVAEDFMSVLKEHSIETIFDYQNLADASKKLLAYGIEYENLMFIMEGLTNLGAMSGDSAALDRIALALGQIYTKGKLSAEEMRQLANAYIPITEILQDKFGLSGDDLKRVGDLNLPAADVINAIVDYANENFGSVGDAAMYTITGLQNKIVDSLKVVGTSMLQPLTNAYKSFLAYVSSGLESIRSAYETGGVGGVFEFLVPDPSTQQVIRQFLANLHNLFMSLASVATVVGNVFGKVASVVVSAFNILSPLVVGFINTLYLLINRFLNTEFGAKTLRIALVGAAAAFVLLKVQALGALVITAVTNAVTNLSKALLVLGTVISKHPIVALLIALAATLLGVSVASNKANSAISGVFDTLSGATGGTSSDEVLQRVNQNLKSSADAADQFNNRLKDSAGAANDLSKAINGTGKEAKKTAGLLSFDEVFKLPEQKDSSDASGGGGSDGLLGDLENLAAGFSTLGDALIPEIPDFSDFASEFTDSLFGGLDNAFSERLKNIGTGSLIGGLLGFVLGIIFKNPKLGAQIGTLAGGFAAFLWDELEGAVNNTATGGAVGVWTALSNALTKAGATVGLGTIIKQVFKSGGLKGVWSGLAAALKNGGWKAIAKGGVIGMAIGLVVDGIAHLLWSWLDEKIASADKESAKVGQTIGGILGSVIGGLIGGPAGALIGSAIGTFVGGFIGLFWDPISEFFADLGGDIGTWVSEAWADLSSWWNDTTSGFSQWVEDTYADLSSWWTDTTSRFSQWVDDTWTDLSNWWNDTTSGFAEWWSDTTAFMSDWDNINSETVGLWCLDTYNRLSTWWNDTTSGFSEWWSDTTGGFTTWFDDTVEPIRNWATDTYNTISGWVTDTYYEFSAWGLSTYQKVYEWQEDTKQAIAEWAVETAIDIYNWSVETGAKFSNWKKDAKKAIAEWATQAAIDISSWAVDTYKKFTNWKDDVLRVIGGFGIAAGVAISDAFDDMWSELRKTLASIGTKISNWWDGLWDGKSASVDVSANTGSGRMPGHATGGIFNREHIARFAEGNKAEAIIPLENAGAMQPFVDAVSNGIVSTLAPIVAQPTGSASNLPPLYVGTLIADDRGLKELYKKFEVIQMQENDRRGIHATL